MAMEETRRLVKGRVDLSRYAMGALIGLLAAVLVYQGVGEARRSVLVKVGEEAPPVAGVTLAGQEFDFSALRGKTVMVDFWETSCGPCREGMPMLVALAREYRDRDVVLVMADNAAADPPEAVEQFLKKVVPDRPENVEVVMADGASFDRYRVSAIPTTYFISPDGKIVDRFRGLTPKSKLKDALEKALQD